MDYSELAKQLVQKMQLTSRVKFQKHIQEGIHGEAFVLHCIKENPDDIAPGDISEKMCVSGARVAVALNSLENKGLITREIDTNDRRKIIIKLTQKGLEVALKQESIRMEMITKMLMLLGEEDAATYVRIMGKLAELLPEITN